MEEVCLAFFIVIRDGNCRGRGSVALSLQRCDEYASCWNQASSKTKKKATGWNETVDGVKDVI